MRTVRAALALFLLALVTAPALARDTLRVGIQLEPPTLDPTSGAAVPTDEVVYPTIFEGLVRATADGRILPLLATAWAVSPDGRSYTFALRRGVRFHDGTPLTAGDVVFSLARARAAGSTNAQAEAFRTIVRVTAPAPGRVRLDLAASNANLLTLLALPDAAIVSRRSAARLATAPVGTGPFRLSAWQRGDALTLARNPAYWGAPPHLARVRFRFVADPVAAFAAMRAGDIDIFSDFPAPETLGQLAADPRLKLAIGKTEGEVILAFNQRDPALAKLAVRRAIAHALDRTAIVQGAMYGYGTPIGSHFPPQNPAYVDLTGRYPHDPALARRMLAEAGYPNGLALTLKLPPPSYARRAGEIVAAQLGVAGIRVRIVPLEWATWLDEVFTRHDFDLTIVDHAEPYDYDIYGRRDYYFGYDSPACRALLARLAATADPPARRALLGDLQRLLADDAANGFLFQFPRLGVQARSLHDVWANTPTQALDLATARFDNAAAAASDDDKGARGGAWPIALACVALFALAAVALLGPLRALRRLGVLAATLLAATLLIFALVQVAPGDPAAFMMGLNASPAAVAALHEQLGLGGPAPLRYLRWVEGMATGDFGMSYTYRIPVGALLAERLALSLPLALLATLASIAIGIPAGVLAARRHGGTADRIVSALARVGLAVPGFWLAMLLVLLFSVRLGWLPAGGFPGWHAPGPALAALALPALSLALPQAAILARVQRASLLAEVSRDYVRTARAKGLGRDGAILAHALPNALGPVLTVLGLQLPFLLAGGAIVESLFFLPGLGRLVLQAIAQRDLIVVQSAVAVLVAATVLGSFLVDLAYAAIDPRLRA